MNPRNLLVLALALTANLPAPATATAAAAAPDFEGRIDMKVTMPGSSAGANSLMTMYVKQPKARIEMKGSIEATDGKNKTQSQDFSAIMITNAETREFLLLMPDSKMYMVMKDQSATTSASPAPSANNDPTYKRTGRTDTILGRRVEEYAGADSGGYTEMWLATGLGAFRMATAPNAKTQPKGWEKFLIDNNLFPLKATTYKKKGDTNMISQLEVLKIDAATQPDSLFDPPSDYKRMDLSGMMGGMMNAAQQGMAESGTDAADAAKQNVKDKIKSGLFDRLKKLGQ